MASAKMQKAERANLRTVAGRLGVSRTTVSNAYSRPDQLNLALRQTILDVAREIGYPGPHPAASMLRKRRGNSIRVVFTETLTYAVTDPAARCSLKGVAAAIEPTGTALPLLPVPPGGRVGPAAAGAIPPLTTVRQPLLEKGRAAAA